LFFAGFGVARPLEAVKSILSLGLLILIAEDVPT